MSLVAIGAVYSIQYTACGRHVVDPRGAEHWKVAPEDVLFFFTCFQLWKWTQQLQNIRLEQVFTVSFHFSFVLFQVRKEKKLSVKSSTPY